MSDGIEWRGRSATPSKRSIFHSHTLEGKVEKREKRKKGKKRSCFSYFSVQGCFDHWWRFRHRTGNCDSVWSPRCKSRDYGSNRKEGNVSITQANALALIKFLSWKTQRKPSIFPEFKTC